MATACLGFVTFLSEPPERSSPRFISRIVVSTDFDAAGPYLAFDCAFLVAFVVVIALGGATDEPSPPLVSPRAVAWRSLRISGMWLEAIVTEDDVANIAKQFAPLELRLGSDGRLSLSRLTSVLFVPGRGVEVVCDGQLHWPVLGMCIPLTMERLTVLVRPTVETRSDGYALVLRLSLERAGVSHVGLLDDRVTAKMNEELEKHCVELAWNFSQTLTHTFPLPASLLSAAAIGVEVRSGTTRVTREALGLAVLMGASVQPRVDRNRDPA
jgi:hypothetical protein